MQKPPNVIYQISSLKEKNNIITSIDAEKHLRIHIKTLNKVGRKGNSSKPLASVANIIHNGERLNAFLPTLETKQKCLLSPLLLNIVLEVPAILREIKARKINKRQADWK